MAKVRTYLLCVVGFGALCCLIVLVARREPMGSRAPIAAGQRVESDKAAVAQEIVAATTTAIDHAQAVSRRLAYAQDWDGALLPDARAFRDWTNRYLRAANSDERTRLEVEGLGLARTRRAEMRMLIERDPARALASTIPLVVRRALPAAVVAELETRVAGTGDSILMCLSPRPSPAGEETIRRFVTLDRMGYVAHPYGRRESQLSKEGASLHGIALDGQLALHESPLRVLEPGEESDRQVEGRDPFSWEVRAGLALAADMDSAPTVWVEAHGRVWGVGDFNRVLALERRLTLAEEMPGPAVPPLLVRDPANRVLAAAESAATWTTGAKRILVVRVDYSDVPEAWMSAVAGQAMMDNVVCPLLDANSYGRLSVTATVTPKLYRMPRTAAIYAARGDPMAFADLYTDATSVVGNDHAVNDYDWVIIASPDITAHKIPGSTFAQGNAWIGTRRVWLSGIPTMVDNDTTEPSTVIHELGHAFGLEHANLWQVTDGNPISAQGTSVEYGDRFDSMAGPRDPLPADFNARSKNRLGWLPDRAITDVTQSGTYRIYRFDSKNAALDQPQALRIFRDGLRYYWIGYRQNFTSNASLTNGAYIIWGFRDREKSQLLDLTTPGVDAFDPALPIGATLSDPDYGISIRPMARGGAEPAQYLEVAVTVRPPINSVVAWGSSGGPLPANLSNVHAIAAGERHALALKFDGTVVAWGDNTYGQASVPVGLSSVAAIAAGGNVSAAVLIDGSVVAWGDNAAGLVTLPANLTNVRQVAIGYDHALAVKQDGTVVGWGNNASGQISLPPNYVAPESRSFIRQVAAGYRSSFALNGNPTDGNLNLWGASYGKSPDDWSGINMIAAGYSHTLAARFDGTVSAWGDNSFGQCNVPAGLAGVVAVAAGRYHSLALKADGTIVAWGDNASGQSVVPAGLSRGLGLAAGGAQSFALVGAPVFFITQPRSQDLVPGTPVNFTVVAGGQGPFTYQWRRNGIALAGATSATLALGSVANADAGSYDVVVSNGSFAETSLAAVLTTSLSIQAEPRNQFVARGDLVAFQVDTTGTPPSNVVWLKNDVVLSSAPNAPLLTIAAADYADGGRYVANLTNLRGTVTTSTARLTVFEIFCNRPTANVGEAVEFVISSSGVPPDSYQWRRNGFAIAGATGSRYTIAAAQASDTGAYAVVATNADGSFTSDTVALTVGPTAPAVVGLPRSRAATLGQGLAVTAAVVGSPAPAVQWSKNGNLLANATSTVLSLNAVQAQDAGLYSIAATGAPAPATNMLLILGLFSAAKVIGAGEEIGHDIFVAANNNTFDQVLLQGTAAAMTADPGQVTRLSYVDLTNDIVQVEFSGAGTLSLVLDNPTGPATPVNYNQDLAYMKGHGSIVIVGANETTNVGVFSVGRITAVNQALFKSEVTYDGMANIAYLAIQSTNGKFGGVRTANTSYFATKGLTGIYAPGVQFSGPVFVGDINASDAATPVFIIGSSPDTRITGGDLLQANGQPVKVSGLTQLKFTAGSTSHVAGNLPAQTNKARLEQNGIDVTAQVVVNPGP